MALLQTSRGPVHFPDWCRQGRPTKKLGGTQALPDPTFFMDAAAATTAAPSMSE